MRAIIDEGWERVSIPFINERVNTIPARLRAVIEGQGAMTGYQIGGNIGVCVEFMGWLALA